MGGAAACFVLHTAADRVWADCPGSRSSRLLGDGAIELRTRRATTAVLLRLTHRTLGRQEPPYLELLAAVAAAGTLLAVVLYK
jgi:hypothetical protein